MKKNFLIPFTIFILVSLVFSWPVFQNIKNWGKMDWDEVFFWSAVARDTILKYRQIPLWNPYAQPEGSLVFLAYPNSHFLSPFFLLIITFGVVYGLKLLIPIHLSIGLLGMYYLSRHFKLSGISSYLAAFVYMLNSIFSLHLAEGHFEWLTMAFVPWLILGLLKSVKKPIHTLSAALAFALIILAGSVDVLSIIVLFLIILSCFLALQKRSLLIFKRLIFIFGITFLLCSVKLLPMLEYLSTFSRKTYYSGKTQPSTLGTILLAHQQADLYTKTKWYSPKMKTEYGKRLGISHGWHEYGAYTGIAPILLSIVGLFASFKRYWPWAIAAAMFLLISLGDILWGLGFWNILHSLSFYQWLQVPSRFILGLIISLSLFAGIGLDKIKANKTGKTSILTVILLFVILIDFYIVNIPIWKQAFTVVPPKNIQRNSVFVQKAEFDSFTYKNEMRGGRYLAYLVNEGILKKVSFDIDSPQGTVKAVSSPDYKGEAYFAGVKGQLKIEYFSPNKIILNLKTKVDDILVLNQAYYRGWQIKAAKSARVSPYKGLISAKVSPGEYKIVFYFLPISFIIGSAVSLLTAAVCLYYLFAGYFKKTDVLS